MNNKMPTFSQAINEKVTELKGDTIEMIGFDKAYAKTIDYQILNMIKQSQFFMNLKNSKIKVTIELL